MEIRIKRIAKGILNTLTGEENKDRINTCNSCEWIKRDVVDRCGVCECKIDWKSNSPNESCPVNKWTDIKRTQYPQGVALKSDVVLKEGDMFSVFGEHITFINEFSCSILIRLSEVSNLNIVETIMIPPIQSFKYKISKKTKDKSSSFVATINLINPNNTQKLLKNQFTVQC